MTASSQSTQSAHHGGAAAFAPEAAGGPTGLATAGPEEEVLVAETSFAQQSLWLVDRLDPGQPTYNVVAAVDIRGPLDVGALQASFQTVVDRHESLRTTFDFDGREPTQIVHPAVAIDLPVVDVATLDGAAIDEAVLAEIETPFDLTVLPLVRMRLLRRSERDHVAVLTAHHLVTDGWSSGILFAELAAAYEAHVEGRPVLLPELPVQYVDYAVWQRDALDGEALARHVDYWRETLDGLDPLPMPTDRPRPATASSAGAVHAFAVPNALIEQVERVGRRAEATPFMAYLAVFAALLARHAGTADVAVASPVAGRDRPEIAGLIGFFVNTVVLRVDTSGDPSFVELLARARRSCLGAYSHQDVPFDKLIEELKPARHSGLGSPLAQVMVSLQNLPSREWRAGGLVFEPRDVATRTAKFDLSLELTPGDAASRATLEYATELFDEDTVVRLGEQFVQLLRGVVSDPAAPISQHALVDAGQETELARRWIGAPSAVDDTTSVHGLFRRQAALSPTATAVVRGERSLTYLELDELSDLTAARLRDRGIDRGCCVAVLLPAGPELVIAYLGVLKAGGAYVPVDPAYPEERIALLLGTGGVAPDLVILDDHAGASHPGDAPAVGIGTLLEPAAGSRLDVPADSTGSADAAYVIYTSGSTGVPKGAVTTHAGLANLALSLASALRFGPTDRVLQLAPLGFDVVAEELFPHLLGGGSVAFPVEPPMTTLELWNSVAASAATVLSTTPSRLLAVTDVERTMVPANLRMILFGSEAAPSTAALAQWHDVLVDLVQVYGVTEAACTALVHSIERAGGDGDIVPLGRPISGVHIHVVDDHFRPVPAGMTGELLIGGTGVGGGYPGRPGVTARAFVPDPWGPPGSRIYRTGDRVRTSVASELRFAGRADHQVKIRGFRVEPAEVEALVRRHPDLTDAVVTAPTDRQGSARLVAHVVASGAVAPTPEMLRAWASARVPDWMVPSAWVVLTELPRTPNGKVDRAALPAADATTSTAFVAPRTPIEEEVASIWAEVLAAPRVGVLDDFFVLGGNSLAAVRMIAAVQDRLGAAVPVRTLFAGDATVAALASAVFEVLLAEDQADATDAGSAR